NKLLLEEYENIPEEFLSNGIQITWENHDSNDDSKEFKIALIRSYNYLNMDKNLSMTMNIDDFRKKIYYYGFNNKLLDLYRSNILLSKLIYFYLIDQKRISFINENFVQFDNNHSYIKQNDLTSLNGEVIYIKEIIHWQYGLKINMKFTNILPGIYQIIWRMKLQQPFLIGCTEFLAVPD
ncbi:unnamed protein product, partial [Didymodactylos carnosus]